MESNSGYGSCFDQPTADEHPGTANGDNWNDLSDATAALLNPTVLRMFVASLSRSITGNDSQSILSVEANDTTSSARGDISPAPQVTTPMSMLSQSETLGGDYTPTPPGLAGCGFRRSSTTASMCGLNSPSGGGGCDAASSTVMLRNVPYDARQRGVLSLLEEEGFKGRFDFFYAPLDFKSKNNLGYAFVNLQSVEVAKEFFKHFDGRRIVSRPGWDKPLRVCWARVQGLSANIDHYKNSPVNEMPVEFKPMLFDATGDSLPFPEPDTTCILRDGGSGGLRSTSNASTEGLGRLLSRTQSGPLSSSTVRPRERRLQSQMSRGFLTPVNAPTSSLAASSLLTRTPQPVSNSNSKLFVGGLSPETSSEIMGDYMKRFGTVEECHVLMDVTTGRSRCYGFCTFRESDAAQRALRYPQTHWIDGRGVVVRPYTSNQ